MNLKHYIVENVESCHVFGVYAGGDGAAAIRAMLATAGETEAAPGEDIAAVALDDVSGVRAIRYTKALRAIYVGEAVVDLVKAADPTEGERASCGWW